ncbi:hypothetical protein [Maridesulfovibrio ferrireducens]|uniref:hypothetical protein n=1 Tax=Maridesulfovibrio ferrireducens TaxID=246191 RepID=UPI001A21A283|nr:hypothetical protein [Maridesulfovibrio ferrireducens]MBI9110276.1 hypothetical protein [Maridesulfovibrio ferrireducens]
MMRKKLTIPLLLLMLVAVTASGCAVGNIMDMQPVDQATSAADKLMDTYIDVYDTYNQMKANIPAEYAETKKDFVDAMNLAHPAISLAVEAAIGWKEAVETAESVDPKHKADADLAVSVAKAKYDVKQSSASKCLNKALALWVQIKGEQ